MYEQNLCIAKTLEICIHSLLQTNLLIERFPMQEKDASLVTHLVLFHAISPQRKQIQKLIDLISKSAFVFDFIISSALGRSL